MNSSEALQAVKEELHTLDKQDGNGPSVVLEQKTITKPWGWVFFYQSKKFVESGDFRDILVGNAPIIVNRNTGELVHTGTAHDIDYYLKEYEAGLQTNT